ncbi:MAG: signal peptidase II [Polyangiaceae bacterium]
MAKRVSRVILLLFTAFLVGCDHATKLAVMMKLGGGEQVQIVPGVLDLRFAKNDDTAFNLFHQFTHGPSPLHRSMLLVVVSLVVLAVVLAAWWKRRTDPSRALHVGFALIVAGAAGNVIDRALRGYVVDFIHVHMWPVFNVADVLIVAGTILLALVAQSRSSSRDARV